MNILLLTNHQLSLPTIQELAKTNLLKGVATTNVRPDFQNKLSPTLQHFKVPLTKLSPNNWQKKLALLLKNKKIEVVLVLTFKYKIPAKILSIPKWGFINFHPGPLPQYRGPDPVFWQIKNQVTKGSLTVHQMDAKFDTGPIISAATFPMIPTMTHSRFMNEAGYLAVQLTSGIVQLLHHTGQLPKQTQDITKATYHKRPTQNQLRIDWQNQNASAIQALVNACNTSYGGAITIFRQQPLQILQVTPLNEAQNVEVGNTVFIDKKKGWVVTAKTGQLLRIDIVQSGEGIMTGGRFVEMAQVKVGEKLD